MIDIDQYLELHADWTPAVHQRVRINYKDRHNFAAENNLNPLDVMHFLAGNAIEPDIFKEICNILDFDWVLVQLPAY